ncbi:hypothetical protein VOLCADRAFT_105254 [Volvox carteri f. nagariensis]|uniref:Uncharacterized protein n=1 Tax=Volvox carteri f. nagariensis TaxID=3068 RepID=D8TZL7_VOLCA|nr:uncharacterized protein VOLCADRAFT_105254 [Volvox carteri f. nagariensis]EFJ46949.1 hypothetical protein VOLCADRAFT_105254 [Volvox carteri f. nagariensis]|eukprot:XP_002951844.1 hypothetical protein VOLCADRAFT_105254 [Volvox carteri f. nagariensis]
MTTPTTATAANTVDPWALNEDGSARDPAAFCTALLGGDAERLKGLEAQFPEFVNLLRGDDLGGLQDILKRAMQAERARMERMAQRWPERSIDAQRASAPVPRDTVQVYKQLAEAGLEYGPAFRLLRNVHVPLQPDNAFKGSHPELLIPTEANAAVAVTNARLPKSMCASSERKGVHLFRSAEEEDEVKTFLRTYS